jgi:hypothetical protein
MKKVFIGIIGFITALVLTSAAHASNKEENMREINFAGLVVDAGTLLPIESAAVFDSKNNLLGLTDKNGYYKIVIKYKKAGPIKFNLRINKKGYEDFSQRENWGDLPGNTKTIMYFGLSKSSHGTESFSKTASAPKTGNYLTFNNVLSCFGEIKSAKTFNDKLVAAKAGNEHVFLQIDEKYFIANESGWIQISSDKEMISINDDQLFAADELNSHIKRKEIKWMTPLSSQKAKFAVYTKAKK